MKIIGLVGGIGSGKSTVARFIGQLEGTVVIDADQLGHEVLRQVEVKTLIQAQWGDTPFGEDGEIDHRKMAALVFSGTTDGNANLEKLMAISHPRIALLLKKRLETARIKGDRLVLLDAPLLLEGGWECFCDAVVFVDAPEQMRLTRVLKRGWTSEEFHAREARQIPLNLKRTASYFVISNDNSLVELEHRIGDVIRRIID